MKSPSAFGTPEVTRAAYGLELPFPSLSPRLYASALAKSGMPVAREEERRSVKDKRKNGTGRSKTSFRPMKPSTRDHSDSWLPWQFTCLPTPPDSHRK